MHADSEEGQDKAAPPAGRGRAKRGAEGRGEGDAKPRRETGAPARRPAARGAAAGPDTPRRRARRRVAHASSPARAATSTASSAPISRSTFGPIGIGEEPAPVYTVRCDDLSAIVSDTPLGVLDPTRDNVLAHQRVNETVMREHTVLPMSFGTVFKTRDDVTAFLKSAYRAFSDVLDKMENKLEFGLKVLWDRDAVIREIEEEDEDIHRLKNEIAAQKGSTYFARMQYGRLIDAALQARSERYVARDFRPAARRVGGRARQQADRRPHDSERRVPGLARRAKRSSTPASRAGRAPRQADLQVHRAMAAV